MALTTLGKKPVGSIVKIRENGNLVDFYVAKHDYESGLNGAGRTLVVRKYVGRDDYSQWNSIRQNTYAGSTVDGWLNSAYKSRLDSSTLSLIGSTKFPYTPGNGNYALSTLSRPIFLLSAYELGKSTDEASQISEFNLEGSPLPIASTLQVSHIEGALGEEVANQWTRTPTTKETFSEYLNKKAVYLDINGKSNSTYTTNKCLNRPAFTLPSTLYVLEDGTVAENTAPTAPGSINVPQNIKGGASITLSWTVSTDKEGSISWYELEASRGGQSWQQIYKGPETWAKYTVPAGTTTIAFRVRSVDNDGAKSGYTTSKTETVYNNKGPSAPGSIKATNVVQGETATITITAATDPDGTVARYVYERSVNGGGWTSLKETTALAVTDAIGSWKTVAYRAKAVDNEGVFGPYATTSQLTVDKPPTAPKSIQVANAIKGETATITLTAATDPDGTIASYRYQRSVDGGGWVQFADANALTQTDQIQDGWGTVAYRAQAVDDVGAAGPFVTSETYSINAGRVLIGGPPAALGSKPEPFELSLTIGTSDATAVTGILVYVRIDNLAVQQFTANKNQVVKVTVDTRLMAGGTHTIAASAEKSGYAPAISNFTFTVPASQIPSGGSAQVFQDPQGNPVFPMTTARYVIGASGQSIQQELDAITGMTGAGFHNSIYRGKNLGTRVTEAQWAEIKAGTFRDLFIGDYWSIGGVDYLIAAFNYWLACGDTACNTNHLLVVPRNNLYTAGMNSSNITTGGYVGSEMYKTGLAQAKTTINNAFGSAHILNHRQYLVNAVTSGAPTGTDWYDSTVELMNENMVYGGRQFSPMPNGATDPWNTCRNYTIDKSQLPLFHLAPWLICNRQWYWLRDVVSAASFAVVTGYGGANCYSASDTAGVRPVVGLIG